MGGNHFGSHRYLLACERAQIIARSTRINSLTIAKIDTKAHRLAGDVGSTEIVSITAAMNMTVEKTDNVAILDNALKARGGFGNYASGLAYKGMMGEQNGSPTVRGAQLLL